jgi:hypothetical protein
MNQTIQDRIIEDRPPLTDVVGFRTDSHIRGIDPMLGNEGRRPAIVGPDFESVVQILTEVRTTRQANSKEYCADTKPPPIVCCAADAGCHGAKSASLADSLTEERNGSVHALGSHCRFHLRVTRVQQANWLATSSAIH